MWPLMASLLAALGAADPPAPKPPQMFYVATGGDDTWSGRFAGVQPGKADGPFATVGRARDAVRDLKRRQGGRLQQPVVVQVRGGTYRLAEPLVFTPEDSGTAACPVTYEAFPQEKPILSGGRGVTGWKLAQVGGKPLWVADLPEVRAGKWYFHQLWVNDQRRPRARHPKDGFFTITGLPDVRADTPRTQGQNRFQFAPGQIRAWDNLEDVEVVVLHLWVGVRLAVAAVDERERLVTFSARSRRRLTDGNAPARFYVENALALLDRPGEWYLDRRAGRLYYWPLPGEQIDRVEAVAAGLPQLLRLAGKPEANQYVEHLTLNGLTFAHAESWPARQDPADIQAAAPVAGALHGDGVCHCTFAKCTVAHVSGYALHLARGCQHNRVTGCHLFDLGGGGVKVGEMAVRDDPEQQTHDNLVTDNHVHAGGRVFPQAVGLWVGQSYANRLAHNHLHDLYYTGISVGWTWGYGRSLARDNLIEANHVHDLGQGLLSDLGGVYTLGVQPGTVIRGNVFHDVTGYRYGGWGIYFDEGSSSIRAEDNLVYRTTHGGFHQHYGKENVVRNNIFAFGRDAQLERTRVEPHRSFTFERNLVYFTQGKLLQGKWDDDQVTLDYNLYWRAGGGEVRFGNRTWEQWRAAGQDRHSLIADPLFMNPDKADFRLRPGSPAGQVGFRMPDFSGVGPRKEPLKRTDPASAEGK